jgi:hypothetical protein
VAEPSHGTATRYNSAGCRCQECRNARAAYERQRRASTHGRPAPPLPPTQLQETAELVARFVRVTVREQGAWEAVAKMIVGGDVTQRRLLDQAAHLWEQGGLPGARMIGPLPVMAARVRGGVVHRMLVLAVRVHAPGGRGVGLRRAAGSLLCVAPSDLCMYPRPPRPVPDQEPTCSPCQRVAARPHGPARPDRMALTGSGHSGQRTARRSRPTRVPA